jgi:hypothetical protein
MKSENSFLSSCLLFSYAGVKLRAESYFRSP